MKTLHTVAVMFDERVTTPRKAQNLLRDYPNVFENVFTGFMTDAKAPADGVYVELVCNECHGKHASIACQGLPIRMTPPDDKPSRCVVITDSIRHPGCLCVEYNEDGETLAGHDTIIALTGAILTKIHRFIETGKNQ